MELDIQNREKCIQVLKSYKMIIRFGSVVSGGGGGGGGVWKVMLLLNIYAQIVAFPDVL